MESPTHQVAQMTCIHLHRDGDDDENDRNSNNKGTATVMMLPSSRGAAFPHETLSRNVCGLYCN